jgi:hypothetical protein
MLCFQTMYVHVYCDYTEMSCIQNIVKFTHKKAKTLNILVEFPIG